MAGNRTITSTMRIVVGEQAKRKLARKMLKRNGYSDAEIDEILRYVFTPGADSAIIGQDEDDSVGNRTY